ncbi:hypothetical protein CH379_017965 [Leptospira ellisii]|uniref:Uncharacterized protein n=1 Tax=Leptospira ellisii TaxID=2023197 RepID=A0A2N0B6M9_9LEPT|nr:hypothetical protein [Leptospira ellisii]MDV6237522.1 hypothetical protein [Leptospira ellisii]PJZ92212.1 hypothetical protein CH379_14370 [Leptospira ellisii]PKA05713.1 hypothetical protein CH375_03585 [Leptospira ellisii]
MSNFQPYNETVISLQGGGEVTLPVHVSTIGLHERLSKIQDKLEIAIDHHSNAFNETNQAISELYETYKLVVLEDAVSFVDFCKDLTLYVSADDCTLFIKKQKEAKKYGDKILAFVREKFQSLVFESEKHIEVLNQIPFFYPDFTYVFKFINEVELATKRTSGVASAKK